MAGEEQEEELRDLVAQTLESQGVLGKIRAQLRASVFLALEEQEPKVKIHPLVNDRLQDFMKTKDGQITVGLIKEFLEYFELDFTNSVFEPETNTINSYQGRDQLATEIGLEQNADTPLLCSVLKKAQTTPHPSLPVVPPVVIATTADTHTPLTSAILTTTPVTSIGQSTSSSQKPHLQDMPTTKSSEGIVKSDDIFADRIFATTELDNILTKGKGGAVLTTKRNGINEEDSDDDDEGLLSSNIKYDTTDHSLSQSSITAHEEFDYTENVQ